MYLVESAIRLPARQSGLTNFLAAIRLRALSIETESF